MMERTERIIRIVAWAGVALLLIVLALRDIGPGRTKAFDARLDAATPAISVFGPPARVALAGNAVRVVGEPVYANLRIPRWFRTVTFELEYENPAQLPARIGVRTHPTAWQYELRPLPQEQAGTFTATLTLDRAWQVDRNLYQIILAALGADAEHPFTVRSFRVIVERPPFCLGAWCF